MIETRLYPFILYDMTFTEDDLNTYRKFPRSFSFFVRFARRTMRRDRGTCRQLLRALNAHILSRLLSL